jgi:molybdenum cofactor cytidylyltransferase
MDSKRSGIDAVVLASGLSRRMGTNKLLLPLGKSTLFEHVLTSFPFELFDRVIVVAADAEVIEIAGRYPVRICCNTEPEKGKSHSIRLGLAATNADTPVMFTVADQPLLSSTTIRKLVYHFSGEHGKIVMPEVNGTPANPVIFPADLRGELENLQGDKGGRLVITQHPERVSTVYCSSPEEFYDIDTPESYQQLMAEWNPEN